MTESVLPFEQAMPVLVPSRIEYLRPVGALPQPACPACGASTVRRTARSGPRAGLDFWGCVNFPACRGTREIGATGAPGAAPSLAAPRPSVRAPAAAAPAVSTSSGAVHPLRAVASAAVASSGAIASAAVGLSRPIAAAAADRTRRSVQLAAARAVDFGLEVLRPTEAMPLVGGRNVAGASAQAEFERRRARHRLKMRAALPAVVGFTLIGMTGAFVALMPLGGLPAVAGVTAIGFVGLAILGRLPADALAWGRGADGERRTAEFLDELAASGYVVLHDRLIPGTRANVDHVAIGPGGVFVIETKNLRGKLTILGEKLFVGERTRTGIVNQTYREAIAVQISLAERLNELRATVRPILCIHRTAQLLLDNEVQGVRVVSGSQLVRFVRRQPALLDAEVVQELAALADRRLQPALP